MVGFDYSLDQRKPQAGADDESSFFVFHSVKSFKHQLQLIRSNSKTGISPQIRLPSRYSGMPTRLHCRCPGCTDGIRQKIRDGLTQVIGIAPQQEALIHLSHCE